MKTTFSTKEALVFGWEKTKGNIWFLVGLLLFISILSSGAKEFPGLLFLVGIFAGVSILTVLFKIYDSGEASIHDIFSKYRIVLQYLVASVLYTAMVLAGLVLLVIPGVYWAVKYQFYKLFIVDKEMGPIEALRESGKITKGNMWNLIFLLLVLMGLNLFGAIIFGIGLFITIPVTLLAYIFVYKKLLVRDTDSL